MRVRPIATALSLAAAALLWAACGSKSPAPTSPTSSTPSINVCGVLGAPSTTSIINGRECSTASTPVVLLNMRDNSGAIGSCSGTIIAPRSILTAAHCVKDGATIILVFLGSGDQIAAQSWTAHPGYTGAGSNSPDVAVLTMPVDLPRTPMPLLTSRDARVGEQVVVAGWGNDFNGSGSHVHRAGATTLSGVGALYLQTTYSATAASICQGDSGGPLFAQENGAWAIAGVTSAASDVSCNTGTQFYVAVRNPGVRDFILAQAPGAAQR